MLFMDWNAGVSSGHSLEVANSLTKKGAGAPFLISRQVSEVMSDIERVVSRPDHCRTVPTPNGVEV